jgi:nitrite reductase/ring-hydroxylating ferredoxin subunit
MTPAEMKFAYEKGGTIRGIALFAGVSHITVRYHLQRQGVVLRRRGHAAATAAVCPHCGEVLTAADLRSRDRH